MARQAFHLYPATHLLGDATGNDESEAGAAEAAGGGAVGLGKGVEQVAHRLGVHADASVADREMHFAPFVTQRYGPGLQMDGALLGELHGVSEQICQNLTNSQRIPEKPARQLLRRLAHEPQPLLLCAGLEHLGDLGEQGREIERNGLKLQLAGLDLGKVEDVVDQGQQGIAAVPNDAGVFALLLIKRGAHQEIGHAQDGVQGRADLVAHVGQELAFGGIGLLGAHGQAGR